MPNRMLREGILDSERVDALDWDAEVFYRRLMSAVDDFGRFDANPKLLRAKCYPLRLDRASDADVETWLAACVDVGLVEVYRASDGKRYLELLNFRQHTRAKRSKYPLRPSELVSQFPSSAPAGAMPIQNCDADASQVHITSVADEMHRDSVGAATELHTHDKDIPAEPRMPGASNAYTLQMQSTRDAPDARVLRDRDSHAHGDGDGDGDGGEASPRLKRRGTRLLFGALPVAWEPWARSTRPDLDPKDVWDKFRDYWIAQPGQKGVKSDWFATWRNWVREERPGTRAQLNAPATGSTGNAARKLS